MGSFSRSVDENNRNQSSYEDNGNVCPVCKGRNYTLVATKQLNHSSTVYERQVCPACSVEQAHGSDEADNEQSRGGKRLLSGTGYLRNKKRRRKASSE